MLDLTIYFMYSGLAYQWDFTDTDITTLVQHNQPQPKLLREIHTDTTISLLLIQTDISQYSGYVTPICQPLNVLYFLDIEPAQ